jgi:hypothetical protein
MINVTIKGDKIRAVNSETAIVELSLGINSCSWAEQAARNVTCHGRVKFESAIELSQGSGNSTLYVFSEIKE